MNDLAALSCLMLAIAYLYLLRLVTRYGRALRAAIDLRPALVVQGGSGTATVHLIEKGATPGLPPFRIQATSSTADTWHDYTVYGSTLTEALDLLSMLIAKDYPAAPKEDQH